jgi:hypothetical protein
MMSCPQSERSQYGSKSMESGLEGRNVCSQGAKLLRSRVRSAGEIRRGAFMAVVVGRQGFPHAGEVRGVITRTEGATAG